MRKWLSILTLTALAALPAPAAEPGARDSFAAGLGAFATSNFLAAGEAFLQAAAAAPAEKLDPAAAHYNAGLAAYAAGDLEKASAHFANAAAGADLGLQAKAYYNRGNALFHLASAPAVQGAQQVAAPSNALDLGEAAIGQAIQMNENAIALDPKDTDAKANYELAVLKQQEMQQQKQQQQDQKKQDQQNQDQQKQDQQNQEQEEPQDQQQNQQEQEQPQAEPQPQPETQQQNDPQQQEEPIKEEKPSEEMTPEEAAMMLDSMKAQEQSQRDRLHPFFGRPVPVEKDW